MLSIIVPTYLMSEERAAEWAAHRAQIVAVHSIPTEIIVVDNGSTCPPAESTTAWLENKGVAPAWNEGVRQSTGDLLCFMTCTVDVQPGWDARLCAVAESGRYVAMPLTNGEPAYGLGVTGWCWVVRRELFDEVGPFDETFVPVQYEDTDWFHRAIYQHGLELVTVPSARVRREGSRQTWTMDARRQHYIHLANRYRYAWKHGVDPAEAPPFWRPLRQIRPSI